MLKAIAAFLICASLFSLVSTYKLIKWLGYPPSKPKARKVEKQAKPTTKKEQVQPQGIRYVRVQKESPASLFKTLLTWWVGLPAIITAAHLFLWAIWRVTNVLY